MSRSARSSASASSAAARSVVSRVVTSVAGFKLPVTLSRAVAVGIGGGDFEVLTGLHDGDRSTNAVLRVDPARNTVTVVSRLPTAVHDAAGGVVDGVPTVFGGGNATEVADVQQSAPRTAVVARLPVPTSDAVAVTTNRGLVLMGGYDGTRTLEQVLLFSAPGHSKRIGEPCGRGAVSGGRRAGLGSGSAQSWSSEASRAVSLPTLCRASTLLPER